MCILASFSMKKTKFSPFYGQYMFLSTWLYRSFITLQGHKNWSKEKEKEKKMNARRLTIK